MNSAIEETLHRNLQIERYKERERIKDEPQYNKEKLEKKFRKTFLEIREQTMSAYFDLLTIHKLYVNKYNEYLPSCLDT